MVLVDSTIWIAFLRSRGAALNPLAALMETRQAAMVAPIGGELMSGARDSRARSIVLDIVNSAVMLATDTGAWLGAGSLVREWASRGKAITLIDAVIAATAKHHDVPLWTLDRDFDPLFSSGELKRFLAARH